MNHLVKYSAEASRTLSSLPAKTSRIIVRKLNSIAKRGYDAYLGVRLCALPGSGYDVIDLGSYWVFSRWKSWGVEVLRMHASDDFVVCSWSDELLFKSSARKVFEETDVVISAERRWKGSELIVEILFAPLNLKGMRQLQKGPAGSMTAHLKRSCKVLIELSALKEGIA